MESRHTFQRRAKDFRFRIRQSIGVLPTGFSGLGLSPNSVFPADLMVSFPKDTLTDFSIMVGPQELDTDSTATLRVTAYMNGLFVGTNTSMGSEPFLWPSSTLNFSSPQGFNSVVVHYDSPPPTGGDYGTIFVADNMIVTALASAVPEPASFTLLGMGPLGLLGTAASSPGLIHRSAAAGVLGQEFDGVNRVDFRQAEGRLRGVAASRGRGFAGSDPVSGFRRLGGFAGSDPVCAVERCWSSVGVIPTRQLGRSSR